MGFVDVIRIWRRRRGLTAGLVVLALAALVAAIALLPRSYQSQATVVLLASPSLSKSTGGGNPYLSFNSSLELTADVVSVEVSSPVMIEQLAARGFSQTYTVAESEDSQATGGSMLAIAVTGSQKAAVQSTLFAVIAQVDKTLGQLQRGVLPQNQIQISTLSYNPQATLDLSHTVRPIVVVAILTLLLALATPVILDGWISRRQERRAGPVHGRAGDRIRGLAEN